VIFVNGPRAVRAVNAATTTIPIVFIMGEDPVKEAAPASLGTRKSGEDRYGSWRLMSGRPNNFPPAARLSADAKPWLRPVSGFSGAGAGAANRSRQEG
jgi:hypothetical protein